MSDIFGYPTRKFSESQKFFVADPATGTTSLVLGSDLVDYITPSINSVKTETTRAAAENVDYGTGTFVATAGGSTIGDGGGGLFLVVASGEGDFTMMNGNELLSITGGEVTLNIAEIDVSGNTDVTISGNDLDAAGYRFTGTPTANIDVIVPDNTRHYFISNEAGGNLDVTLRTQSGSGVVAPRDDAWFKSDGTNIVAVTEAYPSSVSSVSTLRTSSFPANLERLYLSGYYGVGTPGGGELYADRADNSTADNGGTVFVDVDGVRWKRGEQKSFSPEMFGAKGDGVTDDLQAFKNAFEVLDSQNGGVLECAPGKVYAVSSPSRPNLDIGQSTTLNLMGSEISRISGSNTGNPIIENRTGATRIVIKNGSVRGTGSDNNVSDQGHAILVWDGEAVIQDIETIDTDGDGVATRKADVKFVRVNIGNYGRNGISPTSGIFTYDSVYVNGSPFTGANPGLAFDAENDSSGETGTHVINYIECDNMTFVDFFSDAGTVFNQKVTFLGGIVGWVYILGNDITADKFVIGNNVTIRGGTSFAAIRIENVSGVELKGPTIQKEGTGTTNINAISLLGTVYDLLVDSVNFKPKDDGTAFTSSIFTFDATDIQNLAVKNTGETPQIFLKNVKSANISGGSGDILLDGTGNSNLTVRSDFYISNVALSNGANISALTVGGENGTQSNSYYAIKEKLNAESKSIFIPFPSAGFGGAATVYAQISHDGLSSNYAYDNFVVLYGDQDNSIIHTFHSNNVGSLSITRGAITKEGITLTVDVGPLSGLFNAVVLG